MSLVNCVRRLLIHHYGDTSSRNHSVGTSLPRPMRSGALQNSRSHGRELRARARVVIEDRDLIWTCPPLDLARHQILHFLDRLPGLDSLLRDFPNVGRLVQPRHFLGMHHVKIGAADGLIVDLAALVAGVRTADGGYVHSLFHPMPVEDRIPSGSRGLNEVAALHGLLRRIDSLESAGPAWPSSCGRTRGSAPDWGCRL